MTISNRLTCGCKAHKILYPIVMRDQKEIGKKTRLTLLKYWDGKRKKKICKFCGKEYELSLEVKDSGGTKLYCCKECSNNARKNRTKHTIEQVETDSFVKIKGYDNYYVSNLGEVFSIAYGSLRKLKYGKTHKGYLYVNLSKDGKHKTIMIHRLVAEYFIEKQDMLTEVNHINGNKEDNRSVNLEWCTKSHNIKEAFRLGLNKARRRLSFAEAEEIRRLYSIGNGCRKLSKKYGIPRCSIMNIIRNQTYVIEDKI